MEIRLTLPQFEAIERHFGAELRYAAWFAKAEHRTPKTVDVVMPAIGWLRLQDDMAGEIFTTRGQRSSRVPRAMAKGLGRVARALGDLHLHPALRGQGLPKFWGQVIPSWRVDGAERRSEFPVIDGVYEVLYPRWETDGGLEYTVWEPSQILIGWQPVLDEKEHLAFGVYESA